MADARPPASGKGKPLDEAPNGSTMIVTGRIFQEAGGGVGGLLVEAVDVRQQGEVVRLGSAAVDMGSFSMAISIEGGQAKNRVNLQLRVFAPERPGADRKRRTLFETELRAGAAAHEHFEIELPRRSIERAGLVRNGAATSRAALAAADVERERRAAIRKAGDRAFSESLAEVKERRDLFRGSIRDTLAASLATVTPEERKRGRYVATPEDIRAVGESALKADFKTLTGTQDPDTDEERGRIRRTGRIRLTKTQLQELTGGSTGPVEITEGDLEKVVGTSLDKPAQIYRRSPAEDPCRPRTQAEACLDGDDDHHHGPAQPEEPGPLTHAGEAPVYVSKKAINELMERQASPEDLLVFGPQEGAREQLLEPSLNAAGVSSAIAKVTFAPGPADVPALHFFNDLQIAFEPIWQEALDDRFLDNVEAAYDKFVERGGAPAVKRVKDLLAGVFNANLFLNELLDIGTSTDTAYEGVASVVIITREEWTALPSLARNHLSQLATQIANIRQALLDKVDDGEMSLFDLLAAKGTTRALIQAGLGPLMSKSAIQLRTKLRLLKSDADGIVALARRLVLENEAARPFRPTHTIIEDLKRQHSRAYPFRHFAASPRYRSVNFGLLVTYKQIWTLKAYQVGELVSTLPLAPRESRKYSRRTLRKTKRSVQEVESRFERRAGEQEQRSRIESEIVHRATSKTNFSMSATGSVNFTAGGGGGGGGEQNSGGGMGVSGSSTTTFTRDVEQHSSSVKKEFNEAVRKASEEVKNERKTEITTEESFEEEETQSGEIINPNDEIPCTFLFYELQRRIGIEEKIHALQSVVFVAQEVPAPSELTHAWLIRHDWILSRVLLDPSYAPALGYVSTSLISDDVALREMREALFRQRKLVEDLKQDLADRRALAGLRYAALQKQIEKTAESAEGGGGLFGDILGGIGDIAGGIPIVGGIVEGALDMVTGEGEVSQADQLREGAARDAYEREQREEQDLASRLMSALSTLESMQSDYTDRLSRHLSQLGQVHRLIDHIWQNILYYMQAIWAHEPDDQRFLRLKDVPIPVFTKDKTRPITINPAVLAAATDIAAIDTKWVHATSGLGIRRPPLSEADRIKTVPLSRAANIYKPAGVVANYLVFPMYEANPITDFMMEPYVALAEGEYGLSDPDPIGNMTLDEFADYVCCLRKHYEEKNRADEFEKLKPELRDALKKLLQRSRRDEDIVIPCEDGLYIEALPGAHSVMEQFKHLHRIIDVKSAQADVRGKELDNIRRAERILTNELGDPDVERQINISGTAGVVVPPEV
ncbi:hypothetical protein [Chelatococcus reniformis]|uniref:Uncharacterized protein n=1 Tax=Chelatococcus reniformis TaxID=1494448 RepID=A0A916XJ33_9HYPH|nr:hypothetical protein [Chelatococcus reniformis]GGC75746.1 hypothetical protein GCM10010994_37720 [Chelatococcus reniformis]